jgi:hypothetical protein
MHFYDNAGEVIAHVRWWVGVELGPSEAVADDGRCFCADDYLAWM